SFRSTLFPLNRKMPTIRMNTAARAATSRFNMRNLFLSPEDAPSFYVIISFENPGGRLRVKPVFLGQDPKRQAFDGVRVKNGNRGLQQNRPIVQAFIDEVNRTP